MKPGSGNDVDIVIEQVLSELAACVRLVSHESLAQAIVLMDDAPRIFVAGAGRSGLSMRALAMRLMHLGKSVYVVGETTTTSISAKELLIIGSGSGRTAGLLKVAEQARRQDAKILLFTTNMDSPLSEIVDHQVIIPAPSLNMADQEGLLSVQPMGTLFEQSLTVVGDSLILGLMRRMDVTANQMCQRHANLE